MNSAMDTRQVPLQKVTTGEQAGEAHFARGKDGARRDAVLVMAATHLKRGGMLISY
jgi:hypothetical protein